jgi:hypothetical protein
MASPVQEPRAAKDGKKVPALPVPKSDFYHVTECLNEAEQDMMRKVRALM